MMQPKELEKIVQGNLSHVQEIARLFDLYRQFYDCDADLNLAREFITARIQNAESVIFVAQVENSLNGFVQLYPSFCSVDATKIFILYDLFVDKPARNQGLGARLMQQASQYAKSHGASRLDLLTAKTNKAGQHLYEKLGYQKVLEDFYAYSLPL